MPNAGPSRASAPKRMCAALLMMSFAVVPLAGCVTNSGTAPAAECRGRAPVLITSAQVATMPRWQLEQIVATNEALERECGVKPPARRAGR